MIYHHTLDLGEFYWMNLSCTQNPTTLPEKEHLVTPDISNIDVSPLTSIRVSFSLIESMNVT